MRLELTGRKQTLITGIHSSQNRMTRYKTNKHRVTNPRTLNKGHHQGTGDTNEQSRLKRRTRGHGKQHKTTQTHSPKHRPCVCTHNMRTNPDKLLLELMPSNLVVYINTMNNLTHKHDYDVLTLYDR